MNRCPDRIDLASFLAMDERAQADSALAAHVNTCHPCQEAIRRILLDRSEEPAGGPAAPAAGPPPTPDGYQLLERLGEGGMGEVWKARQLRPQRVVALKFDRVGRDPRIRERFLGEPDTLARLKHPNIVQIYEARPDAPGGPFFAMEYVEGGSLRDCLDGRPWPPARAAALVETLARAVAHAHAQGVVHRDLKPANVLLAPPAEGTDSADGRAAETEYGGPAPGPRHDAAPPAPLPKIADFGLARLLDEGGHQTQTGQILGTPEYMAPEQAAGRARDVGPAVDVHALGVILYELLTGRTPFRGESPVETLERVRHADPDPPRSLNPAVGRDLETICLKCLGKQPGDRYPTAVALADDLRRFLSGEAIAARPPGPWARARRFVRAHAALARVAAALAVVVPATLLGWRLYDQAGRGQDERRRLTAEAAAQDGYLKVEKGEWQAALAAFDSALEQGYPERARLRLERVRALTVLNRGPEAEAELAALAREPGASRFEADRLLWQGDLLLGHDNARGLELVRKAQTADLTREADQDYAAGLLSRRAEDALKRFERAVEKEKFHPRANPMLVLTLIVLGRKDQAGQRVKLLRPVFAEDPGMLLMEAMLCALERNPEEARGRIAEARARAGESWGARAVDFIDLIAEVNQNTDGIVPDPGEFLKKLARCLPDQETFGEGLPIPAYLAEELAELGRAIVAALKDPRDAASLRRLTDLTRDHPDGTVQFVTGLILFSRQRFADAEEFLLRAYERPAVIDIRRPALFSAINCQGMLFMNDRDPNHAREIKKRAADCVDKLWGSGKPPVPWCYNLLHVARKCGRCDIATAVADHWENNGSHPDLLLYRGQIDYSAGRYGPAKEKARQFLEGHPGHREGQDLLAKAEAGLRE